MFELDWLTIGLVTGWAALAWIAISVSTLRLEAGKEFGNRLIGALNDIAEIRSSLNEIKNTLNQIETNTAPLLPPDDD